MKIKVWALLMVAGLLTACLADQEESTRQLGSDASQGSQQGEGTAQVEFSVHLPDEASAAFIDTENTRAIVVSVFPSSPPLSA